MAPAVLKLHLILGSPELLGPARPLAADAAQAAGRDLSPATADWLAAGEADHDHLYLLEGAGDRRVEVTAHTLSIDFGPQVSPCLVLPILGAAAPGRAVAGMLARLAESLSRRDLTLHLVLHGLTLADQADTTPDLRVLTSELQVHSLSAEIAEPPAVEPAAGSELDRTMRRNCLANSIARQVVPLAAEIGLTTDVGRAAAFCEPRLRTWEERGLGVAMPLRPEHLKSLAETMMRSILMDSPERTVEAAPSPAI
jgi:hypothetical protein